MANIPSGAPRDPGTFPHLHIITFLLTSPFSHQHRPVQACVSHPVSVIPRLFSQRMSCAWHMLIRPRRPGYGPVLSYLQAAQLESPLRIHPLLNLRTWDPKPYGKYLAWNCIEVCFTYCMQIKLLADGHA